MTEQKRVYHPSVPKYTPRSPGLAPDPECARDVDPGSLVAVLSRGQKVGSFFAAIIRIRQTRQPNNPMIDIIKRDGKKGRIGGGTTVRLISGLEPEPLPLRRARSRVRDWFHLS